MSSAQTSPQSRGITSTNVRRHPIVAAVMSFGLGCVLLMIVTSGIYYIFEGLKHPMVLLTGPEGSHIKDMGESLHLDFAMTPAWRFWGRTFEISPQQTDGSQYNRQRINNDTDGVMLGFAWDGFEPAENVCRILTLREEVPLLILANKQFLEDVNQVDIPKPPENRQPGQRRVEVPGVAPATTAKPDSFEAPSFSKIAASLKSLKAHVYLGPTGSGTREIAEFVLNYHEAYDGQKDTCRDLNFVEAVWAVHDKKVDMAFVSAQL